MRTQSSVKSPLQKNFFGSGAHKVRKNRYQRFPVLSNFAGFHNFFQNIWHRVVTSFRQIFMK